MANQKHTKIIATIGPASESPEIIKELIRAGVNVFRFNMKHNTIDWHRDRIDRVQQVADRLKTPIGVLIDLQGPELRIETPKQKDVSISKGERIWISESFPNSLPVNPKSAFAVPLSGTKKLMRIQRVLCLPHRMVLDTLRPEDHLLIDDGLIELVVRSRHNGTILAESLTTGVIAHRKGLNIPGKTIDLPSLIDDDLTKLDLAAKGEVDFIALSFSRTKKDIGILRKEMKKRGIDAQIVAKIESQAALDHLDELVDASDAVMVARGDLGIEVPIEQLAYWQKNIITMCRMKRKPVIVATQMLQSMIDHPRPTRAEATDVANAIFDGADALMLSGETAMGKHPVRVVEEMVKIAEFNETKSSGAPIDLPIVTCPEALANAAVQLLNHQRTPRIDAVVVFTETGHTARNLAIYRPNVPVIAVTDRQKTVETLTLSYGIHAYLEKFPSGPITIPNPVITALVKRNILKRGQTILVIHGQNWREPGLTNALAVLTISEIPTR